MLCSNIILVFTKSWVEKGGKSNIHGCIKWKPFHANVTLPIGTDIKKWVLVSSGGFSTIFGALQSNPSPKKLSGKAI